MIKLLKTIVIFLFILSISNTTFWDSCWTDLDRSKYENLNNWLINILVNVWDKLHTRFSSESKNNQISKLEQFISILDTFWTKSSITVRQKEILLVLKDLFLCKINVLENTVAVDTNTNTNTAVTNTNTNVNASVDTTNVNSSTDTSSDTTTTTDTTDNTSDTTADDTSTDAVDDTSTLNSVAECWNINWTTVSEQPSENLCTSPSTLSSSITSTYVNGTYYWTWYCNSEDNKHKVSCKAAKQKINWQCWTLHMSEATSVKPTPGQENLCSVWTMMTDWKSSTSGWWEWLIESRNSEYYAWHCFWIDWWSGQTCFVPRSYTSFYYKLKTGGSYTKTSDWERICSSWYSQTSWYVKSSSVSWCYKSCDAWYTMVDAWVCIKEKDNYELNMSKIVDFKFWCEKTPELKQKATDYCSWLWLSYYYCEWRFIWNYAIIWWWSMAYSAKCQNNECSSWNYDYKVYYPEYENIDYASQAYGKLHIAPVTNGKTGFQEPKFVSEWSWKLKIKVWCQK